MKKMVVKPRLLYNLRKLNDTSSVVHIQFNGVCAFISDRQEAVVVCDDVGEGGGHGSDNIETDRKNNVGTKFSLHVAFM